MATAMALGLTLGAEAQTGRTMQLVGGPVLGTTFQTELHYPAAAAGNINGFLWSNPYVGSYPVSLPGLTVLGSLRVDALSLGLFHPGVCNTSGSAAMSVALPNTSSLLGAALDCQGFDWNVPQATFSLADNDLEIVISDQWALRTANVTATANYVRVPQTPALQPQTLTIDVTFRPQGTGFGGNDAGGVAIVNKPIQGGAGIYIFSWSLNWSPVDHRVRFLLSNNGGTAGTSITSVAQIPLGAWARATATVDANTIRLYIDGVLDGSVAWTYPSIYYGNQDILFGAANFCCGFARRFDGTIDQVSLWNRALSAGEVSQIQPTIAAANGLLGLWNFELSLQDSSGQGHHGVAVGTLGYVSGR